MSIFTQNVIQSEVRTGTTVGTTCKHIIQDDMKCEKYFSSCCPLLFSKALGFTLAEVLITLLIIGVVAAITIPTLLQNQQDKATVAALKKAYSTLSSAYTLAVNENGSPENWFGLGDDRGAMVSNLKPYLNVLKDCSAPNATGCFKENESYKNLDATNIGIVDNWGRSLLLVDGSSIHAAGVLWADCTSAFSTGSTAALASICGYYYVDVNGFKSPNIMGKDTFFFYLTKYGILPAGSDVETWTSFTGACLNSSGAFLEGTGCTSWILQNDNLDYLKCPSTLKNGWAGQTSCN